MTVLGALAAQVLHMALMAAAAPTLTGLLRWFQARMAGHIGSSPLQPWQDFARLLRKQSVRAEDTSAVTTEAPIVSAAALAVAASLVPSFTLGMTFARFADLLVIAGLLALGRAASALVAMDPGAAQGGIAASRTLLLGGLAECALLLVLFALALFAGSLNVEVIAAMRIEIAGDWRVGLVFALAATLLVALVDAMRREMLGLGVSGSNLALLELADALRLLVWLDLIGALFLPFGVALAGAGLGEWAIGIFAWLLRLLVFVVVLVLSQTIVGSLGLAAAARTLGVALLLGMLAVMFVLADMSAP
ncbi:MAG TPA: NADH-quinone oxidoreductase subunit H [Acetobacteraceae bacterium]|nr:NADH-quinone oxidoreductase subunit H [Acetobacteraceae bacterium]